MRAKRELISQAMAWMAFSASCASVPRASAPVAAVADPPVEMRPSSPGAATYSTAIEAPVATDPFAEQIQAALHKVLGKHGGASVVRDGRLDRVAYDIARHSERLIAPPLELVIFLLGHYGVPEPEPNLFLSNGDDGAEASGIAALSSQLSKAAESASWRRMGVAVARSEGKWSVAIIFQEKNLDLEPFPRQLPAKGSAQLKGKIRRAFSEAEVLVTPPKGAVGRISVMRNGDAFSAGFVCRDDAGAYQIEVNAEDKSGPRVLANFPVYCGTSPPDSLVQKSVTARATTNVDQAEKEIFERLNQDRQKNGLPALSLDSRLASVARRYSQEMLQTGKVGHISPRSGTVLDRIRAAGIAPEPTSIAENVGSISLGEDMESNFMASPGHRDNILSRDVTHVGIGVAVSEKSGQALLFVTQVFAGFAR
jgi:uncharacterized protein YkwD